MQKNKKKSVEICCSYQFYFLSLNRPSVLVQNEKELTQKSDWDTWGEERADGVSGRRVLDDDQEVVLICGGKKTRGLGHGTREENHKQTALCK